MQGLSSMEKKNLLLVTHGFPYGDGETTFLGVEYECLIKRFHVTILAYDNQEDIRINVDNDVKIVRYSHKNNIIKLYFVMASVFNKTTIKESVLAINNVDFFMALKRIKQILFYNANALHSKKIIQNIIEQEKIDLVYTYWCLPETLAALYIKEHQKIKVVTRVHGIDLYRERIDTQWQPYRDYIGKCCDMIATVSESGKKYFDENWGGKTRIAYIGTKERMRIRPNYTKKLVLISCSRLIGLKRVDMIIEALAILPENVFVEWHHFGDGLLKRQLKELADIKLNGKVNVNYFFEGFLENERMIRRYFEIKPELFITTSETEGSPISLQESLSMGIPAIATGAGGIPEIIKNGINGFLVDVNVTTQELSKKVMEYYYLSQEQKERMSEEALKIWKQCYDARENAIEFSTDLLKLLEDSMD